MNHHDRKQWAAVRTLPDFGGVNRRITTAIVAAAVPLLLLAGCVSNGTVTDKSHSKPYTTCSHHPTLHCTEHDECWRLHLRSNRGDIGEQCVTKEAWDVHPVGSYYEGGGS